MNNLMFKFDNPIYRRQTNSEIGNKKHSANVSVLPAHVMSK